jgi:hypothetical protein
MWFLKGTMDIPVSGQISVTPVDSNKIHHQAVKLI